MKDVSWQRSSFSDTANSCVEVAWTRSSRCAHGDCVEVSRRGVTVWVRDSKDLTLEPQAWDLYEWSGLVDAVVHGRRHRHVTWFEGGVRFGLSGHELLEFTEAEWAAFVAGVKAGDFEFDKLSSPASSLSGGPADAGVGPDIAVGSGQEAATGAAASDDVAAPVAADVETVPAGQGPLFAERPIVTTGAGKVPAAPDPAPVVAGFAGSNVSSYVPAGQLNTSPDDASIRGCANTAAGQPGSDPFRLADWRALPDRCGISGCDNEDADQRGPVFMRDGSMHKVCTDHWEPIMRVLGDQATWERDALRWGAGPLVEHVPGEAS